MKPAFEELSTEACHRHLRQEHVGRMAVVVGDHPEIFPVNYVVDENNDVWFRTDAGTKLDAVEPAHNVAFEIDGIDESFEAGWSVLVVGQAHRTADPDAIARVDALGLAPWAPGEKENVVQIKAAKVTGRRIYRTVKS